MTEPPNRTLTQAAVAAPRLVPEKSNKPVLLDRALATTRARDLLCLGAVVAALAFLWGRGRHVWYWVDEGIAVGIASHPLTQIPELLRLDGSPPLYYALLNVWMSMFGTSEPATHVLSLIFALASVPVAFWAGRSLWSRRAGWMAVALVAVSPFVARYVNETRMYTLLVLLGLASAALFAHVFVFERRRYRPALVGCLTLLLYTHNWAIFFVLGLGAAVLLCAAMQPERAAGRARIVDGAVVLGVAGLLYAPWLPILAYQVTHTGAPFALRPTLQGVRNDLMMLVGGREVVLALGLGSGVAFMDILRRPRDRRAMTVIALATIVAVTVVTAWGISRDNTVWVYRYLAVLVGPVLLVLAMGLSKAGRIGVVALAMVMILTAPIDVKGLHSEKSNAADIARQLGPRLVPGDLVVADFGRVPLLAHYLPEGLTYAETTGPVADPLSSDQRNGTERLRAGAPSATLGPLLDPLEPGRHLLLVCAAGEPPFDATEFLRLIFERCHQALDLVLGDPRFRLDAALPPKAPSDTPVSGYLFTRVGTANA
ncbi:MAG: glycosyltransferase family 39 protein [Actinomycetota bacterium]|nr:glycosyltransferase family 39 protein [Actinomycetota bacterium]